MDGEASMMREEATAEPPPGTETDGRSARLRIARITSRVLLGFVAFLLVGNGLILASTAWFQWSTPDRGADTSIDNFTQVDGHLYRGAAPGRRGLREVAALGVTTIVDLRAEADLRVHDELLDELGLNRHHIPIRDGQLPDEEQTARFLRIVEESEGPVFLHCGAGVGRTGAMSAFYLNATGQADGTDAARRILAVGPPSLEQITFAVTTAGGDYDKPGVAVTALSRVLDGPRRIWHNIT